jgi:hypothetical protein
VFVLSQAKSFSGWMTRGPSKLESSNEVLTPMAVGPAVKAAGHVDLEGVELAGLNLDLRFVENNNVPVHLKLINKP